MIPAPLFYISYLLFVSACRADLLAPSHLFRGAVARVTIGSGEHLGLHTEIGNDAGQLGGLDPDRIETDNSLAVFSIDMIDTINTFGFTQHLAHLFCLFGVLKAVDRQSGVGDAGRLLGFGLGCLDGSTGFTRQGAFTSLETGAARTGHNRSGND